MGQLEALRHLQNRQRRNIFVRPVAEHLRQEQNILENLFRALILPQSCHGELLYQQKRRCIGLPMSAFAQPQAKFPMLDVRSNRRAREVYEKSAYIMSLYC
jgi:hypothetical protein